MCDKIRHSDIRHNAYATAGIHVAHAANAGRIYSLARRKPKHVPTGTQNKAAKRQMYEHDDRSATAASPETAVADRGIAAETALNALLTTSRAVVAKIGCAGIVVGHFRHPLN
jgi:hypothetical protein